MKGRDRERRASGRRREHRRIITPRHMAPQQRGEHEGESAGGIRHHRERYEQDAKETNISNCRGRSVTSRNRASLGNVKWSRCCFSSKGTRRCSVRSGAFAFREEVGDQALKSFQIDWLEGVMIEAGFLAAFAVLFLPVAGERDQEAASMKGMLPETGRHFAAVHLRVDRDRGE